jgi:ribonuclease P protein component
MVDQDFPASRRLLTSAEFDAVFKKNQAKVSTPEFLFLATRNQQSQSRLGMVVSKKNTPLAVGRNQLKRLIREVFRKTRMQPIDIVVLPRTGANKLSKHALTTVLEKSFEKVMTRLDVEANSEKHNEAK